jgi:hypothetical protein
MPYENIRALDEQHVSVAMVHEGEKIVLEGEIEVSDGATRDSQPVVNIKCDVPNKAGGTSKYSIPLTGGHLNGLADDHRQGRPLIHLFEGVLIPHN